MARYCTSCGQMIENSAKFCTACGKPIKTAMAEPQKGTTANAGKKAPKTGMPPVGTQRVDTKQTGKPVVSQNDNKQAAKPAESPKNGKKKGFFAQLWAEMLDLLKHPKKLIPTFVLAVIWLVMPMITGFITGANIPIVRFFCTLTYANGGIFGGFFGTVGGIFGKAIFAAVVNGFVLSLCAKKNPFKGVKKGFGGVFAGGLKAISPLLTGGGAGLVLYWFFNITSAPQNSAIAVVAAIAAIQAVGKQNGLLFGGVFYFLKKLSKGKAPSKIAVSRILMGLSAGFAIGFALTFIRYAFVIVLLGVLLLAAGIGILFIGKNGAKKTLAAASLIFMLSGLVLPFFAMPVSAAANAPKGYKDPADLKNMKSAWTTGTPQIDGYYLEPMAVSSGRLNYDVLYKIMNKVGVLAKDMPPIEFTENPLIVERNGDDGGYSISGELHLSYNGNSESTKDYYYEVDYSFSMALSNIEFANGENRFIAEVAGEENIGLTTNDPNTNSVNITRSLSGTSEIGNVAMTVNEKDKGDVTITFSDPHDKYPDEVEITFRLLGYLPKGKTAPAVGTTDSSEGEDKDEGYVPYHGHLTYNNGRKNKRGQPFPDLMDFNRNGEIDFEDLAIQKELSHNPDLLDTPEGAGLAVTVITTTVIGTLGGTAISTATSAGSSALSSLASNFDFPEDDDDGSNPPSEMTAEEREYENMVKQTDRYISTDSAGDLIVSDPVTGAEKHYIRQEDGSYRQLESGQSYTKDEIRNDLAYVERNAGYYSDVENTRAEAAEYQREHASDLSEDGKKMSEMMRQEKAETERQDRLYEIGAKHGVYSGDEAEIREKMAKDQAFEEQRSERLHEIAENIDTMVTVAETTQTVADISLDALETVAGPAGKAVNATYKVVKGATGKGAEAYAKGEDMGMAIAQGTFEGSVDALTGQLSGGYKAGATVTGETAKGAMDAYVNDKDMLEGAKSGFVKGTVSAGIDAVGDTIADKAKTMATKDVSSRITNAISDESAKEVASTVKTVTRGVDMGGSVAGNLTKNHVTNEISADDAGSNGGNSK